MDLVGLLVNSPSKVGRDIGDIGGIAPLGITATDDVDEIIALDADVVLHMPLPSLVFGDDPGADLDHFCRLLASGKHVITTVGYMYPKVYGHDVMGRLSDACAEGGVAFHGTGANPGWFGDLLPLLMSGLSLQIDQIDVQEISTFQHYPSPEIMFEMMNFGCTPEEFEVRAVRHRGWLDGLFTEAVQMVADVRAGDLGDRPRPRNRGWDRGGRNGRRSAMAVASHGRRTIARAPGNGLANAR
jgi:hypothetical protein